MNNKRILNLAPLLLASVMLLAYAGSFRGVFLFDDHPRILEDPAVRSFPECLAHSSRPLTMLTFYANYALGGFNSADFHVVNIFIHLAAGLLLFGVLRLMLVRGGVSGVGGTMAATIGAGLWALHPLQTESVTYISQRAESLAGLFYILAMYVFLRGVDGGRSRNWLIACVIVTALGMTAKVSMITAPLAILLYDWLFVAGSLERVLEKRRLFHLGMLATWLIPIAILVQGTESSESAGFGSSALLSPVEYFGAQQGVLLHYLKLAVFPKDLCLDYMWHPPVSQGAVLWPGLAVAVLLALGVGLAQRRYVAGFGLLWFLLAIAPSSSFVPVADLAAEHRMYVPLAGLCLAVVALMAGACRTGSNRIAGAMAGVAICFALALLTNNRNEDYSQEIRMWRDVVAKRPDNIRAYIPLVNCLLKEGNAIDARLAVDEAISRVDAAMKSGDDFLVAEAAFRRSMLMNQYGRILLRDKDYVGAERAFRETVIADRSSKAACHNLGLVLYLLSRKDESMEWLDKAIGLDPCYVNPRALKARMLIELVRYAEASAEYEEALERCGRSAQIECDFAWLLATCSDDKVRDGTRAVQLAGSACEATGGASVRALDVLAASLAESGEFQKAALVAESALRTLRGSAAGDELAENDVPVDSRLADEINERISLYRAGQPFRMTPDRM